MLTSERWVERQHAEEKHWLAGTTNSGPVYIAFHSCLGLLRHIFEFTPERTEEFAEACIGVKNARKVISEMGFNDHPTVHRLNVEKGVSTFNRDSRKLLIRVLYHVDMDTLYKLFVKVFKKFIRFFQIIPFFMFVCFQLVFKNRINNLF